MEKVTLHTMTVVHNKAKTLFSRIIHFGHDTSLKVRDPFFDPPNGVSAVEMTPSGAKSKEFAISIASFPV